MNLKDLIMIGEDLHFQGLLSHIKSTHQTDRDTFSEWTTTMEFALPGNLNLQNLLEAL